MTNILNKTKSSDVQTHIETSFEFINKHLPSTYVDLVNNKLEDMGHKKFAAGTIRNVKNKGLTVKAFQNLIVIKAMMAVANDVKEQEDGFIDAVSKINP